MAEIKLERKTSSPLKWLIPLLLLAVLLWWLLSRRDTDRTTAEPGAVPAESTTTTTSPGAVANDTLGAGAGTASTPSGNRP